MAKGPSNLAERLAGGVEAVGSELQINDSLAANLTRAEIDQQIATARKYPRMITTVVRTIETLATLDEETAAECTYALSKGGSKITGPSIRFAEIVMQAWGNCRVAARVTAESHRSLEATGIYHDLETNMAIAKSVTVGIMKADGSRYSNDMIVTMSGAGASKAMRNAILAGVPKGIWNPAYKAAQRVAKGDAATLTKRRGEALAAFKKKGVPDKEVFEVLEVQSEADITLDTLLILRGLYASITTGEDSWGAILSEHRKSNQPPEKDGAKAEIADKADAPDKTAKKAREGFDPAHVERETRGNGVIEGEVIDPETGEITGPQDQAKDDAKPEVTDTSTSSDQASSEASDDGFPGDQAIADLNRSAEQKAIDRHTASGGTGSIQPDPRPAGEGTPARDEVYWYIEDTSGQDGKWPTYKNGQIEGRANIATGKKLKVYFDHYEPSDGNDASNEEEKSNEAPQSQSTASAKPAETTPVSSASATDASSGSAGTKAHSQTASSQPAGNGSDEFDFGAWQEKFGATTSWLQMKPQLVDLKRSAFWLNELEEADRQAAAAKLWAHVLFVKEKFNDPVLPAADASAFALWIYFETDPKAVLATVRQLAKMPAWQAMSPPSQAKINKLAEDRIAQLEA